jgi:hypothetical protein
LGTAHENQLRLDICKSENPMKATDLLKRQQCCIRALIEEVDAGQSHALVQLARLLTAQTTTERELFYPAVLHLAQNEVLDAFDKQVLAERAVRRALAARMTGKAFPSRVATLKLDVGSFVEAEERSLLPCIEGKVPTQRLEALGEQMEQRFQAVSQRLWQNSDYRTPTRRARATQLTRLARARNAPARSAGQCSPKRAAHHHGASVGLRGLDQHWGCVA